jgi:hypothetical protein
METIMGDIMGAAGAELLTFVILGTRTDGIRNITIVILPTNIRGADVISELTAERPRVTILMAVEEAEIIRLQLLARRALQIQLTPPAVHEENRTSLQNGMSATKEHEGMQL